MAAFTVSRSSLPCLFLARVLILLAFHSPSAAFKGKEQTFLNFFFSPSAFVHSLSSFASLLSFGMHFYKKKRKKFNVIIIIIFFCRRLLFIYFFFSLNAWKKNGKLVIVLLLNAINVCFIVFGFLIYIIIFTEFFVFFIGPLFFFPLRVKKKKKKSQSVIVFKKPYVFLFKKKKIFLSILKKKKIRKCIKILIIKRLIFLIKFQNQTNIW